MTVSQYASLPPFQFNRHQPRSFELGGCSVHGNTSFGLRDGYDHSGTCSLECLAHSSPSTGKSWTALSRPVGSGSDALLTAWISYFEKRRESVQSVAQFWTFYSDLQTTFSPASWPGLRESGTQPLSISYYYNTTSFPPAEVASAPAFNFRSNTASIYYSMSRRDVQWILDKWVEQLRAPNVARSYADLGLLLVHHLEAVTVARASIRASLYTAEDGPRTTRELLLAFTFWTGNPPPLSVAWVSAFRYRCRATNTQPARGLHASVSESACV